MITDINNEDRLAHPLIDASRKEGWQRPYGRSYYPLHDNPIAPPQDHAEQPDHAQLRWHKENRFLS